MVYKLKGVVQHYDWGGYKTIPSLLGQTNDAQQPWAEYWMGTHPKGEALVVVDGEEHKLSDLLAQHPEYLGDKVSKRFGGLPFLFKVLDVRQMLSIQLHPTKEKAELGFAKEEALGIPRLAPNRNYKDRNHKPEIMVALTDFWLLHGFKGEVTIGQTIDKIPAWRSLIAVVYEKGIEGLYQKIMLMPQKRVNRLLEALFHQLKKENEENRYSFSKENPDYWAWQAFQNYAHDGHYDRGIFSIYILNLLQLKEGEGIFQEAGMLHAYLEGVNIELMANSDNVLRGGLTPKHIDVPELLDNVTTSGINPFIIKGQAVKKGIDNYFAYVSDFSLDKISVKFGDTIEIHQKGPAIYLIIDGNLSVNGLLYHKGEAFFVSDGTDIVLENKEETQGVIFKAYA